MSVDLQSGWIDTGEYNSMNNIKRGEQSSELLLWFIAYRGLALFCTLNLFNNLFP